MSFFFLSGVFKHTHSMMCLCLNRSVLRAPGCAVRYDTRQRFCCPGIAACIPQLLLGLGAERPRLRELPQTHQDSLPLQPGQDLFYCKQSMCWGLFPPVGVPALSAFCFVHSQWESNGCRI